MHETHVPETIPFRTARALPGVAGLVLAALVLLGAAAAIFAGVAGETERMWQSLLINWMFWSSLGIGMVMFAVALHITEADWAWSIRRIAMGGAGFLPISFVLFVVVLFGYGYYFEDWLAVSAGEVQDDIVARKLNWLNMPWLVTRNVLGVATLYAGALAFVFFAIRPDVYQAGERRQAGLYGRLTRGWRGASEEATRSRAVHRWLAPVLALVFVVVWGVVGMDMAMSAEPHWFSTMFPVAFFVTAFVGGIAATAIATTWLRGSLRLEAYITPRTYHDLGKLLFAFATFWMYINWSQYMVIWYGLLPHEQAWMIDRFTAPYDTLVLLALIFAFVLPFFGLLARAPKRVPAVVAMFAGFVLVGHWIERYLLLVPSIWPGDGLPLGLVELGVTLGFGALFVGSYAWFMGRVPILPSPATLAARKAGQRWESNPEVVDPHMEP